MTKEELNFIKDAFSQIIDDIAGNPKWGDAAKAVASDLGTLERKLEKRVTELPSNLDEAAYDGWALYEYRESPKGLYSTCYIDGFKAGAKWMAEQGETVEGYLIQDVEEGNGDFLLSANYIPYCSKFKDKDKVIVQIRKK